MLGNPNAPATLTEYIDLQCPVCQVFESTMLPTLVQKYVRSGQLNIKMQPWSIRDFPGGPQDSTRGQKATIAASLQNRAFPFAELLYLNQGQENTRLAERQHGPHRCVERRPHAGATGPERRGLLGCQVDRERRRWHRLGGRVQLDPDAPAQPQGSEAARSSRAASPFSRNSSPRSSRQSRASGKLANSGFFLLDP